MGIKVYGRKKIQRDTRLTNQKETSYVLARKGEEDEWQTFTGVVENISDYNLKKHISKYFSHLPYQFAIRKRRITTYKIVCPFEKCKFRNNKCEGKKYKRYTFPLQVFKIRRKMK